MFSKIVSKFYLFVLCLICLMISSCNFFASFEDNTSDETSLSFEKDNLSLLTGSMETLKLSVSDNQNNASITWTYDESIIKAVTDNYGVVLTGLSAGQTELRATYNGNGSYASCLITVSGDTYRPVITNPYVYASRDYISISPKERVRISAALFGGTPSDINGFNWSLDRSDVASISTEGNYCWITGLANGTTKLTLRHPKATYSYSVLIDVSGEEYNEPYITTGNNIVTIDLNKSNKTETAISVKLLNSTNPQNEKFKYTLYDQNNNIIDGADNSPIIITETSGNLCQLSATKAGDCILRVSHEQSKYPLDILVRVLEKTDGSYIELTQPIVNVTDNNDGELKVLIADTDTEYDPSLFEWEFSSEASLYASWTIFNGNGTNTGDRVVFKGEHTGNFKVKISYPGMNSRTAVIIVRDLASESSKATTTITTSQSYVSLEENEEVQIDILLTDCSTGDINNLLWSIINTADDGSSEPVISWLDGNGKSTSRSSRSARTAVNATYNEYAWCKIKGLKPGTATIEISHPKALYSTKIDIKVKAIKPQSVKKSYLSYNSNPIVYLPNGEDKTLSVNISGDGNLSEIEWNKSGGNDSIQLIPADEGTCVIKAPLQEDAEPLCFNVIANHPYCEKGLSYTIYTFNPNNEENKVSFPVIPLFYTNDKLYQELELGINQSLYVEYQDIENPVVIWSSSKENVVEIESANDKVCRIKTLKTGTSVITASVSGFPSIEFVIKVYDSRKDDPEKDVYIYSTTRTLYFDNIDSGAKEVSINVEGMNNIDSYTTWFLSDETSYSISYNGNKASIIPLKNDTDAYIIVSNTYSSNSITINLRTGNLYEYKNEDYPYIELSNNVLHLLTGQKEASVTAKVIHTACQPTNEDEKNFTFTSDDSSIVRVNYVDGSNAVFIEPLKEGKTTINVHHNSVKYDSEIQVIVDRPGDIKGIPYITSDMNVITVIQGDLQPISVNLVNLNNTDSTINSKFRWEAVGNEGFVEPVAQNGLTCMVSGNKPGTQKIKVTHEDCLFPFYFTVICLDTTIIETKPYIKTDKNILILKKGESANITAELLGGTSSEADNMFFTWSSSSNTSIIINPTGSLCYVKGFETGMTKISVKNSRYPSSYTKEILVIVENPSTDDCYIKVSDSIIKIKPDNTNTFKVTAELVNGNATDPEDFIWWCDDYGLVMTTSIAGECNISPKGQSGSTKLHVKHPKSSQTIDILISVSEYQDFAFSQQSMNVRVGKIYFIPMHVPTQEKDFKIHYVSSDDNIVYAAGSNETAFIAPRHAGNAFITANMTTMDGELISQTEILLNVEEDDILIPTISIGSSCIINMEEEQDITLSAIISGSKVSDGEKYNLKWEVISGYKDGLIFKNGFGDGTYTGADALISCIAGDIEYVVKISHESTGAETYLWIKTTKKGEKRIELSSYYESAYKSDGSFKITANVVNGKDGENKQIEWSAVKNGGQNVVSVPKTPGPTCTVTPKSEGVTTVTARLPDGTYADCQVIILADAVIKFATSNIHVMPGETQAITYYTEPANCTIQWYDEMNSAMTGLGSMPDNYFSYTVNESEKKIYIKGEKEFSNGVAGTLKAIMTSTKCTTTPCLNVYVEYYSEMTVTDTQGSFIPNIVLWDKGDDKVFDNGYTFLVTYSPKEMKITADPEDPTVIKTTISKQVIKNSVGKEIMQATVKVTPIKEGSTNINVITWLDKENISKDVKKTRKIGYQGYYENYTIELQPEKNATAGAFTEYKDGNIYLADGEEIMLYAQIKNKYATGEIKEIVYNKKPGLSNEFSTVNNSSSVNLNRDTIKKQIKWNSGKEYDRSMYGSNDSITPTPDSGLISLTAESSTASTKKLFKLKHCFDYYKDLSDSSNYRHTSDYAIVNYLEGDDIYYMVTKDMYLTVSSDQGVRTYNCKNNEGIYYWAKSTNRWTNSVTGSISGTTYSSAEDRSAYVYPVFTNGETFDDISFYERQHLYYTSYSWNIKCTTNRRHESSWFNLVDDGYWYVIDKLYAEKVYHPYDYNSIITKEATGTDQNGNTIYRDLSPVINTSGGLNPFNKKPLGVSFVACSKNLDIYDTYNKDRYNSKTRSSTTEVPVPSTTSWYTWHSREDTTTPTPCLQGDSYSESITTEAGSYTMYYDYFVYNKVNDKIIFDDISNYKTYYSDHNKPYYIYTEYRDVEPYVITRSKIMNNDNYYFPGFYNISVQDTWCNYVMGFAHDIGSQNYGDNNSVSSGLLHKYIKPIINPNNETYNGKNNIDIGQICVRYKLARPDSNVKDYEKTIPIKYSAYKCEAYKKK